MTFIVECSVCSQAWEVPSPLVSVPGRWVHVPEHGMLNPQTSEPMSIPCPGTKHWGIGLGRREDWEQNWSTRKPGRPRPKALDGSPIRVITI